MTAELRRTHRYASFALAVVAVTVLYVALWFRPAPPLQPFPQKFEEGVPHERAIQSDLLEPAETRL
jgi:hypothetical protein